MATAAMPGLKVAEVRGPLRDDAGEQVARIVDTTGNSWTVVAPKAALSREQVLARAEVAQHLHREAATGALSFGVSRVAGIAQRGPDSYVMVYSGVPGTSLAEDRFVGGGLLAASLARSLAEVHSLDPAPLLRLGVPSVSAEQQRAALRATIGNAQSELPGRLRKRWLIALDEDSIWTFDPVPTHGNLTGDMVMVDGEVVVAMGGFDYLSVADPAADLAWLLPLADGAFVQRFVSEYGRHRRGNDLHIETRAQLLSEVALLEWLQYGQLMRDSVITLDGQVMLEELDQELDGALLVESSRPVTAIHFTADQEPLNRITGGPSAEEVREATGSFRPEYESFPSQVFSSGAVRSALREGADRREPEATGSGALDALDVYARAPEAGLGAADLGGVSAGIPSAGIRAAGFPGADQDSTETEALTPEPGA